MLSKSISLSLGRMRLNGMVVFLNTSLKSRQLRGGSEYYGEITWMYEASMLDFKNFTLGF